jgi:hypothetical protein
VRGWSGALRRHQVEIDELNVYPVPDGDTGTNLVLTVTSAWQALAAADARGADAEDEIARLGRVLRCMARGALLGRPRQLRCDHLADPARHGRRAGGGPAARGRRWPTR